MAEHGQANAAQAAAWNEGSGKTWASLHDMLDRMLAPLLPIILDAGFPGDGGKVLDIGCGAGATTFAMAQRVGPAGGCVGLDISEPLVPAATRRAAEQGVPNVRFVLGDAQTVALDEPGFDAVISRFGVMFFDDPIAAFTNIRHMARPGARLAFTAWRSPDENDFMTRAAHVAAPLLPPMEPVDPTAPGPFAFADGARVAGILRGGGWSAVDVAPVDIACEVSEADLMTYVTRLGSVGAILREADPETVERVTAVLVPAYAHYVRDGVARFTAACWLVQARA